MIAPVLLFVAALVTVPQEATEAPSSGEAQTPSPEATVGATRAPFLISGGVQSPAEVVAARVRSVLQSNSDDAWFELADALPDLALAGGADLTSMFEAAQMAEQAGASVRRVAQTPESAGLPAVQAWAASITRTQLVTFALAVLTLSMVAVTLLRRRGAQGTLVRRSLVPTSARDTGVTSRFAEACHLATAGLAVPEIARRTGMAQDAVTLLVGLRSQ